MTINRRDFLAKSAMLSGAVLTHQTHHPAPPIHARPVLSTSSLAPFVDPLPLLPIAHSSALRPSPGNPAVKVPYYKLTMQQLETQVHRDMKPTRMWGFNGSVPGPTIEVRRGREILVEWANALPEKHLLPIDYNLHGAEKGKPEVRAVVHLHGAKVPPQCDGYPEDWYVPGKSSTVYYPNQQNPAMLWYHDHAMGINRLNTFAGLVGAYILRDDMEDAMRLPNGPHEIPLILADRLFDTDSQLYYPISFNPGYPWTPEFFGDAYLVNGKLLPYLDVEPRKYRFRLLNASNARFYTLSLSNRQSFQQIGTDQGLLPAPVPLSAFVIAPGERVDFVIDFSNQAGEKIVLLDKFLPVMQFRVSGKAVKDNSLVPATLRTVEKIPEASAVKTRRLTLDQINNLAGEPVKMLLNNTPWHDPVTENPVIDSTEIWEFVNPTDDSHPIHLHLVKFQILDRRTFDTFQFVYQNTMRFTGPPQLPDASEAGWKDTVRAHPGMVTRIIVKFEGYVGRYVWHCHILEHEDNEMMRPYEVLSSAKS